MIKTGNDAAVTDAVVRVADRTTTGAQECGTPAPLGWGVRAVVAVLVLVHSVLLAWAAYRDSATLDEVGHFAAGLSHWHRGNFDQYRVNPPLVRMVACLPVLLAGPTIDTRGFDFRFDPRSVGSLRPEFLSGRYIAGNLGAEYFWLLTLARWACIPFSVLGAVICFRWANELYGWQSGVLATALWAFCPNILAHGHLITPDVGAAALGVACLYMFWKWLRQATWARACGLGLVLGLAELTKTTWLILLPVLPILWLMYRMLGPPGLRGLRWRQEGGQLLTSFILALWVLNLGYGFEGSFKRLGDYEFVSESLAGTPTPHITGTSNRFAQSSMRSLPVPVPSNYLQGIDYVKWEFERKMWSYLRGEWRKGGWWYYYLYALLIKVPAGTWLLVAIAAAAAGFRPGYSAGLRDELVLLLPLVCVLTLVSSQTGFNHHLRYALPIFPLTFILIARLGRAMKLGHVGLGLTVALALGGSVVSSLRVYPHSISYFNEFIGGPRNGRYHLLDSNIDWGQDLFYLKRWVDRHPAAKPLYVAYGIPYIDPKSVGISYDRPPAGPNSAGAADLDDEEIGPKPGWYAMSVLRIHDYGRDFDYFLDLEPVDVVGYSIYIYHITPESAARLKQKLGSPGRRR